MASDGENLVGLWFDGQKYFLSSIKSSLEEKHNLKIFIDTKNWLDRYFAGKNPSIKEIPIAPQGSKFRQSVWKQLCKIPYGEVSTYGKIAQTLGKEKMSAQAVGGAVGHNPISIIIPCHRVIGANGSLTGYAGGLDKKIKLLELESTV